MLGLGLRHVGRRGVLFRFNRGVHFVSNDRAAVVIFITWVRRNCKSNLVAAIAGKANASEEKRSNWRAPSLFYRTDKTCSPNGVDGAARDILRFDSLPVEIYPEQVTCELDAGDVTLRLTLVNPSRALAAMHLAG